MRQERIKNGLFGLLIFMLLLPLLQKRLHLAAETELHGAIHNEANILFSPKGWWEGTYQEQKAKYLNDSMGFRTYLVKINNQFDYSLMGKIHANEIVEGKEHYLFEQGYINAMCGKAYPGIEDSRIRLLKLKMIQDTLKSLGKSVLIVHAPSKTWLYPEYIPEHLRCDTNVDTRYKDYLKLEDSLKLNVIDFNQWFVQQKNKYKDLLFTRQGVHWSIYAALLAADSIIKKEEQLLNVKLPHIRIKNLIYSDTPRNTDNDLAMGMNLFFPVTKEKFCYPEFEFISDSNSKRPNAFYMGDSFFWTILYHSVPNNINEDWLFWYSWGEMWYRYNGVENHSYDDEYDWKDRLTKVDMILLMSSEVNLVGLGNGFIEQAFEIYYPDYKIK